MRKRKRIIIFIEALLLLFLSACSTEEGWKTSTLLYFDTVCQVRLFCRKMDFPEAQKAIEDVFREVERLFSPESTVLDEAEVISLYKKAWEINEISGGLFDISVAPLSRLWGFTDKNYRVPLPEEIQETLLHVGLEKTALEKDRIILPEGMTLDWGGIAKGYGIDQASNKLIRMGFSKGFINAGGDLFCWGRNPAGDSWQIGITHPRREGFLAILEMTGIGAATTGDYQRFFQKGGVRYHHVFNPKTGLPARGHQSVTVVGPETLICDALSTALFISHDPAGILRQYPEYGAVLVDSEGKISESGKKLTIRYIEK